MRTSSPFRCICWSQHSSVSWWLLICSRAAWLLETISSHYVHLGFYFVGLLYFQSDFQFDFQFDFGFDFDSSFQFFFQLEMYDSPFCWSILNFKPISLFLLIFAFIFKFDVTFVFDGVFVAFLAFTVALAHFYFRSIFPVRFYFWLQFWFWFSILVSSSLLFSLPCPFSFPFLWSCVIAPTHSFPFYMLICADEHRLHVPAAEAGFAPNRFRPRNVGFLLLPDRAFWWDVPFRLL